mmetsp:Transcript_2107/g.13698  ORF Transcript_2107/g.13698 Transcript_2107/m.13698 type:complete len:105 (+) Transcript_2107:1733-2047(+)
MCVPMVPIAVLFRSSRRLTSPTQPQASTLLSLQVSCNTPLEYIRMQLVLQSHALHATYLYFSVRGDPVPSVPSSDSKPPGWEYLLQTGATRVNHHDCTEVQPID